ncbi:prepilin-type N-terminal cleavage/methylation domain-containing protein [Bittarella massiliensis (ex Durand et al. 2017)]|uniref:prepilin-type N-terminal cleavage/methylation domain-containing protein n=1 Tax=Bittarella massiliensis (ex Durand et al. 2017) TaxID=1720313 RepID=UPI001AA10E5A|nr:prepilin-type N-terminal cleavage/methylation domain-containing protein [Bittarella massiliensis (ex Durand et al. 2017)]MBO1680196.1 prepilin-type N-terminal cleavage/methylation domain-containing protein [Bittarella massiliensis (ex Durand et al. 2017)]
MKRITAERKTVSRRGFTLVEVIVVLVILAILAALLIPSMVKWIDKARWAEAESKMAQVRQAVTATAVEAYADGKLDTEEENDRRVDCLHGTDTVVSAPGALQDYFVSHLKSYLGDDVSLQNFWIMALYNRDGTLGSMDIIYYMEDTSNPLYCLHYHEDAGGSTLERQEP